MMDVLGVQSKPRPKERDNRVAAPPASTSPTCDALETSPSSSCSIAQSKLPRAEKCDHVDEG
ncbi:hypothetical protein P171DRAFT_430480 [Karstenula rhodostoma CBS 690.94]|uniref:Uncharacterized protein n=1 Tax=Karstenula rhodostoma CBS 690.94 TaxID=1392251 RepID=A0A9P4PNB3_9PLEO|nr:hypothetical protein P171DRAFT_430480 [Karstenula rhodostoma CBS 690.94]